MGVNSYGGFIHQEFYIVDYNVDYSYIVHYFIDLEFLGSH